MNENYDPYVCEECGSEMCGDMDCGLCDGLGERSDGTKCDECNGTGYAPDELIECYDCGNTWYP